MIIVDTSVWIDYLHNVQTPQTNWLEIEMRRERLGITDLILCEVLQGIRLNKQYTETREALLRFAVFSTGGAKIAIAAAENYRHLRAKGYTVRKTIDCLIATFCIVNGHSLLHNDKDFEVFEQELGLRVVHPT